MLLLWLCASAAFGKRYAIVVSGAVPGYEWYRHPSGAAHVRDNLLTLGEFSVNDIVTFSFDDVPWSPRNPYVGKLFSGECCERDVYQNAIIDYRGENATAEHFLRVLRGESAISSDITDHWFVFLTGLGSPESFEFPVGPPLYAPELHQTLRWMHEHGKYQNMAIYIETSYSGSFGLGLRDDLGIVMQTASGPNEDSWACCFEEKLDVYTANVWSLTWFRHWEHVDPSTTTLREQYRFLREHVAESRASVYGDLRLLDRPISDFLGQPTLPRNVSIPSQRTVCGASPLQKQARNAHSAAPNSIFP